MSCFPRRRWIAIGAFLLLIPLFARGQVTESAAGATAASITAARDAFRVDLGGGTVAGANGSFGGVRREINWDGVPDALSAPNLLPANFFNVNSPRGVIFATPGTGFQVSANAGVAPIQFDNIDPTYSATFEPFSSQRLFTSLGSNILDVNHRFRRGLQRCRFGKHHFDSIVRPVIEFTRNILRSRTCRIGNVFFSWNFVLRSDYCSGAHHFWQFRPWPRGDGSKRRFARCCRDGRFSLWRTEGAGYGMDVSLLCPGSNWPRSVSAQITDHQIAAIQSDRPAGGDNRVAI